MNFNDREQYLPDILNQLDGLEYYINDFSSTGITYYDLCDKYNISIGENIYSCILFNDEIKITQGIEENIYTELLEESETDYTKADKTDRRINQTYIIVDKQNQKITELASEVGEYDSRITTVEQDVNEIKQTAISYEDLVRNEKSVRMLHIENAFPSYPVKFSIKNMSLIFPSPDLYPSTTLFTKGSYLIIDKTQQLSEDAKKYKLPITRLYVKDNVYDEFIIEKKNMYIIHRIGVNPDGTTYILQNEIIEDLGTIDIELFEGDNYIYLYSFQEDGVIYEITYTIPSEFTNIFATEVYVDSSITQTANQIMLQVNEKVDENEIIAKLNVAVEDGQGIIELKGNTVTIDSDYFSLDETGRIDATSGEIGGFNMDNTSFNTVINGLYKYNNFDSNTLKAFISGELTETVNSLELYDLNNDGRLSAQDYSRMRTTLNGEAEYYNNTSGKFYINSDNPKYCASVLDSNDNVIVSMGLGGINSTIFNGGALVIADEEAYSSSGLADGIYGDKTGNLKVTQTVTCNNVIQTSLEENKKNFEKYKDSALKEIKNIDIYKYNLKNEKDNTKKHLGFIIGDKYNYSQEITSMDNKGVDNYSFTSLLCKAIQEQQEQIEELKQEINKLKEER